jgi:hypothetical protein
MNGELEAQLGVVMAFFAWSNLGSPCDRNSVRLRQLNSPLPVRSTSTLSLLIFRRTSLEYSRRSGVVPLRRRCESFSVFLGNHIIDAITCR